jgi:hypothetical protein
MVAPAAIWTVYHSGTSIVLPDQYGKPSAATPVAAGNFRFTSTVADAVAIVV